MEKIDFDFKLELNRKRIYPNNSVKYLGIKIDENLTWIDHINDIAIRFNRANAMLFKVREFVNTKILKFRLKKILRLKKLIKVETVNTKKYAREAMTNNAI